MTNVIIIGAGPAGLTAAFELLVANAGFNVTVLEESEELGGISKTVYCNGNYMDIGGHRFFSKDHRIIDWWTRLLPIQSMPSKDDSLLDQVKQYSHGDADPEASDNVLLIRNRVSRIYYKGSYIEYPMRINLDIVRSLGIMTTLQALISYAISAIRKLPENNLENFLVNRFGKVLYSIFFEGYTEKLWGRHPSGISAEWGPQRIKGISLFAVIGDAFFRLLGIGKRKVETSLIDSFYYPKFGPGQFWTLVSEEVCRMGGSVNTSKRIVHVERNNSGNVKSVITADNSEFPCNILISSMPVKDLIVAMGDVPPEVVQVACGLPYRDFQTVGVLLPNEKFLLRESSKVLAGCRITPDCWIYVQDPSVKMGRLQIFNNWSPYMVKDFENTVWIGTEYFCDEHDEFWNMSDDDIIAFAVGELKEIGAIKSESDVVFAHRERMRKAYPAYFDSYSEFDVVREFLNNITNLYCIGRNGQHRYNNMDHSMVTAFEAVENIIHKRTDKDNIWNVNIE